MSCKQKELFSALTQETGIKELQEYFTKIFQLRGFEKEQTTDKIIMLIEEVGELAKAIRKENSKLAIDYNRISEYESIEGEIADVFIVLISICINESINLVDAVLKKEKINIRREWSK